MADENRLHISPYARKTAKELGIDVDKLTGTGPGGRIVWRDVDAFATERKTGTGAVSGYVTTADVTELLRALSTLNGALTWKSFAEIAAKRLHTPIRFAQEEIEGMVPSLPEGETAVLAVGCPTEGKMRLYLVFKTDAQTEEDAANTLKTMRSMLENPLFLLL